MNCSELHSRVSELLDNELSYSDSQKINQHLQNCGDCSALHAGMVNTRQVLASALPISLSIDFVPRLQEHIRAEMARGPSLWQQITTPKVAGLSPMSLSGLALATVSAFLIGVSLFQTDTAPLVAPPVSATGQLVPAGATAQPVQPISPLNQPMAAQSIVPDSVMQSRDSTKPDFSKRMKLVNQDRP